MWLDTLVSVCTWAWAFDLCGQAITSRPSIVLAVVMTHGIPRGTAPRCHRSVRWGVWLCEISGRHVCACDENRGAERRGRLCALAHAGSPEPKLSLRDKKVPILALTDALQEDGWRPVLRRVEHSPDREEERQYDGRNICGKRAYLQCLLFLGDIFGRGQEAFPSSEPAAFFTLLRLGGPVQVGLGVPALRQLLAVSEPPEEDVWVAAVPPAVAPRPQRAALPQLDEDSDFAMDGGAIVGSPRRSPQVLGRGESSESGQDIAVDGPAPWRPRRDRGGPPDLMDAADAQLEIPAPVGQRDLAAEVAAAVAAMPRTIAGMPLVVLRGRAEAGHSYAARVSLACPAHPGCSRTRSCALLVERFGPRAAALYLSAWASRQDLSPEAHRAYRPSVADMQAHWDSGVPW